MAEPQRGPGARIDSMRASRRDLRRRSLDNLLRMGHCAPTVMKTVLDVAGADAPWLVKLTAGLPGGIGNSRNECGGVTSPLVLLGLRHARDAPVDGIPVVVHKGQALLHSFKACHGTTSCRGILGDARLPLKCVGVVRLAAERFVDVRACECASAIQGERREAYALLHEHLEQQGLHCAHAVLRHYDAPAEVAQDLLDATSAFVGGTVFEGMTCSALTAGVMLVGLEVGEVEDSRPRVLRLIATMALGGNAFADDLNAFNRAMNLGHELARWFAGTFGSTQCREITGCDFGTLAGVRQYVERGCATRCREIAGAVALQVRQLLNATRAPVA
jgi:hypothetical protein